VTLPRWLAGVPVGEALSREHNGFTLLRLALALAVIVSHAFSVTTGAVDDEPLYRLTGFTLGEHAVNGFFAVSGFLVTMSYDRRGARDFILARALRIAPGLIAATLVVALLLGGAMTRLPLAEYLASPGLWRFVTGTLTTFKSSAALPGVFEQNPFRFPMGTVWTLKYEVFCYAGVLLAGFLGLLRRRGLVLAVVVALAAALALLHALRPEPPKGLETALRLPLIFAAGAALYVWRDRVRLSAGWLALACVTTAALGPAPGYPPVLFLTEAYGAIWLALAPGLARPALDLEADFSYGTYLYGWPVQQALHAAFPAASAIALLGPSLALTLGVAALSWFGVERPALRLKARALGRETLRTVEPAGP
jgi:peptidoglycan/LPS O-acetylase OafA/YrhL